MSMEMRNPRRVGNFTREQKLVATVWYHERLYTGLSLEQLAVNFKERFQATVPHHLTLKSWERKLFQNGRSLQDRTKNRPRTNLVKFVYIPYVRDSFIRFPNLTVRGRAQMLGISMRAVREILKEDITPQQIELLKNKGRKNSSDGSDKTVKSCSMNNTVEKSIRTEMGDEGNVKIER